MIFFGKSLSCLQQVHLPLPEWDWSALEETEEERRWNNLHARDKVRPIYYILYSIYTNWLGKKL